MILRTVVVVSALVWAAAPVLAAPQPAATTPVAELEQAIATGLVRRDRAALDRLLAPDFVLRGTPDVDRTTWLDRAVSLCWGDRADIEDLAVRTLGDSRIATFVLTTDRDPLSCQPAIVRSLITDVWSRGDDGWRLVLRQSGPAVSGVAQQYSKAAPPPPRWSGRSELSYVATAGNTSTQTLGAGGELAWRPGPWLTRTRVNFVRATTDGTQNARSLNAELRQSRDLTPRLGTFVDTSYLRDTFSGIEHRIGVDAGLAWTAAAAPHELKLDAGVGYTHENRLLQPDRSFATGTLRAGYRTHLTSTTEIRDDAALTANLQQARDWRVANTAAVIVGLNGSLSLKFSYALNYLREPVPGFKRADTVTSAALVAHFAR